MDSTQGFYNKSKYFYEFIIWYKICKMLKEEIWDDVNNTNVFNKNNMLLITRAINAP